MEGQIRKQRQKEIYERQELIRKIWEWIGIIVLCITVIGFITLLGYLYVNKN
jgi:predicted negative regulator of RcsB-dependent stress response